MKNNLKKIKQLLFLFTMLFIASCSKDTYDEVLQENVNTYKVRTLNSKDLKKENKLVKKLDNLKAFTKLSNNNRIEFSLVNNFSIETNNVKLIETDSFKTYTFKVNRDVDNGLFENLQITKKTNGTYVAKLLQYDLTSEEKVLFLSGGNIDVNGKLATINIDDQDFISDITSKSSGDCYETVMIFQEPHNCLGEEGHTPGDVNCPYWFTDPSMAASYGGYEAIVVSVDCYGGGDDLGGGVVTTPVGGGGSSTFDALDTFYNSLTIQQMDWLDGQTEQINSSFYSYLSNNNFNTTSSNNVKELINILLTESNIDSKAITFYLNSKGKSIDESFIQDNINLFNSEVQNQALVNPFLYNLLATEFTTQCAILRFNHPDWSNTKIYWEASKEIIHITLDVFGLVPVVGEAADLVNGVLYTIEGDGVNATLSYASAIPVAGWVTASTKFAIKVSNVSSTAYTVATKVKLTWKIIGGVVSFGDRSQLRKVLGMGLSTVDPRQAHHIIPWNKQSKSIVQRASKSGNAFHMNEALNGIPLSTAVHSGSHANYDNILQIKFDQFNASNPNATPDECYDFLTDLIQDVRNWIATHPNTPINNIVLP